MPYSFSTAKPAMICAMCGNAIEKVWSSGGIGKVCMNCVEERDKLDLIELGLIRNIVQVDSRNYSSGYSYEFEAKIDDKWVKCIDPCGDWSYVPGYPDNKSLPFSIPVGWWELDELYKKHNKD